LKASLFIDISRHKVTLVIMNDKTPWRSLEDLVAKGETLIHERPFCHKTRNDLAAATFLCKLHQRGFEVALSEVRECIRRMQIAVDTGVYPEELLRQAEERIAAGSPAIGPA
jgi:hypothetical protein